MLITGVIHGGTLSMTRLLAKPEFYRWRNIEEEKWNENGDVFSAAIGHAAHGLTLALNPNPNLDPSPNPNQALDHDGRPGRQARLRLRDDRQWLR